MKKGYFSVGTAALLSLGLFTSTYAADACSDAMGHSGNANYVSGNQRGAISGTQWGFEQWADGGNNTMKYYGNGTFEASWNNSSDYLARVGFRYGDDGPGVDHNTKHYAVDYKYTKTGQASYGYIGVYGWTTDPQVEYYIVDDWFSQPSEHYIGPNFGEITVDGAKYTIHAFIRYQEPSKSGTSTFVQFFSVRETPRQCGHIDISAHFKKWDEIFKGQNATLPTSKQDSPQGPATAQATLKFGKVTEVMLMTEAGGNATGSVDYTYFNMVDNADGSSTTSSASTNPTSSASATSQVAYSSNSVPGTIEFENFDKGGEDVAYSIGGYDSDYSSTGYRDEQVEIIGTSTGHGLGYITPGDWMEYTINVTYTGTYDFEMSAGTGADNPSSVELSIDGQSVATAEVPVTDWSTFSKVTGTTKSISAGPHVLRVTFTSGYVNADYIKFTEKDVDKDNPYTPPAALAKVRMVAAGKDMQVFDMQGRNLGRLSVAAGASIQDALFAKFHKPGIYLVKQGSQMMRVRVTR